MIRNDLYARHMGIDCRFWEASNSYILQTDYNEKLLSKGFRKYDATELKDKVYKEVTFNDIESAFEVSTFCTYKGFKCLLETLLSSGLYRIRPLSEAQIHFRDYEHHGYEPVYEVEESELEEIWEERKPIDEFLFDVEPIFYIKKNIRDVNSAKQ